MKGKDRIYLLEEIPEAGKGFIESINILLGFLSPNNYSVNQKRLKELLGNQLLEIYLIEMDDKIVGMGSLHYTETLVKKAAWIEDVVVHPEHRKKGLGKKIITHMISRAKKKGVKHVDLTSRNNRVKAHKFYQKINFEKRKSSIYRFDTKGKK